MKNLIPASLSLDELAAYFDGETRAYTPEEEAFLRGVEAGALDLEEKEYALSRTLNLRKPLVFRGNGARLTGAGAPLAFCVTAGEVRVQDLHLQGFPLAVDIDPLGKEMENVHIERLDIQMMMHGIFFGSSVSGGVLRHIHISDCDVTGSDGWVEDEMALSLPFNGCAALGRANTTGGVCNCLLEDAWLEGNRVHGGIRVAVNLIPAMPDLSKLESGFAPYENNRLHDVHIVRNEIEECWDGAFNILGGTAASVNCEIDGLELAENKAGFGITSLYLYANEPVYGSAEGCAIRNVTIRDNEMTRVVQDVGEPTRGFFIAAARADYYNDTEIRGALMENVEIYGNTMRGAGVVLCGAYALLDGRNTCEDNVLRNVHIHDNHFYDADYAFIFEAAQMEGRRYDWNFGYPRHEKKWLDPVEDDRVLHSRMKNNRIEHVLCENNRIDGYRYRIVAAGADIRGHGFAEGNRVCDDIVMRNNHYGVGECHVRVAHYIGEDFCQDGGGNEVDEKLRER